MISLVYVHLILYVININFVQNRWVKDVSFASQKNPVARTCAQDFL